MTYYIFTLGCQMNKSDSERIVEVLESCGLKPAPEKKANLIIVNACSVRQAAVDRIYGKLRNWQKKRIFITGCVLPADKKKLSKKVERIFPIADLPKLPNWLGKRGLKVKNYFQISGNQLLTTNNYRETFVPIMTGCNNFCAYCAVPYTRGREFSRKEEEIICEVENLVKSGTRQIVLLGQNVNSYGLKVKSKKAKGKTTRQNSKFPFIALLEKLIKIPGDFKIKFLTSNPWDFSEDLIQILAKEPKLSKEIHLPLQSGDNGILRKMNRKYTARQYLDLVNKLRSQIPNLSLSTDIIVGFPSETKKAFENTVKLCQKVKFNKAYIACYSPRPGTLASKIKNNVSQDEKKKRWKLLDNLINK